MVKIGGAYTDMDSYYNMYLESDTARSKTRSFGPDMSDD